MIRAKYIGILFLLVTIFTPFYNPQRVAARTINFSLTIYSSPLVISRPADRLRIRQKKLSLITLYYALTSENSNSGTTAVNQTNLTAFLPIVNEQVRQVTQKTAQISTTTTTPHYLHLYTKIHSQSRDGPAVFIT